jgi:hypothetical protein
LHTEFATTFNTFLRQLIKSSLKGLFYRCAKEEKQPNNSETANAAFAVRAAAILLASGVALAVNVKGTSGNICDLFGSTLVFSRRKILECPSRASRRTNR